MINEKKLNKLITKRKSKYRDNIEFINDIYSRGLNKHGCMILELLLLNKDYDSIMRTLLFTTKSFEILIDQIYVFLKTK